MMLRLSWDKSKKVVNAHRDVRPPTTSDYLFPVPTVWVDEFTDTSYLLLDVTGSTATWLEIVDADRVSVLEDTYVRCEIFEEVGATSGTLSPPTNATIVMDQFAEDVDALCTVIPTSGQKPLEELERTASGDLVTVVLSGTGNTDYTLSGTPVGTQYAIQYVVDLKFIDFKNIDRDIVLVANEVNSPVDVIKFQLNAGVTPEEGEMSWNTDDGTLQIGMPGGNVVLQVGQETLMKVKSGGTITNGQPVYVSGASGNRPQVQLADADSDLTSHTLIGVATEDLALNDNGYITVRGLVRDVDTRNGSTINKDDGVDFEVGDCLYLSEGTTGTYTKTKPSAPYHGCRVAMVVVAGAAGVLCVAPDLGEEITSLHDVDITGRTTDDGIFWDGTKYVHRNATANIGSVTAGITGFRYSGDLNTDSEFSCDNATRTFTIAAKAPAASFDIWSLGTKYTKTSDSVVFADIEGVWFFYYNSAGVLVASQTEWDFFTGKVFVSNGYWDATNKVLIGYLGEERHGCGRNLQWHWDQHERVGSWWESGVTPSVIVDGNGSLDSHCEISSVTAGECHDEDIENFIDSATSYPM